MVLAGRPYASIDLLFDESDRIWWSLDPCDWLEAFSGHPRIGDRAMIAKKFTSTAAWAQNEQAAALSASDEIIERLAVLNREYENKFGFIFLICATDKSATEMIEAFNLRLKNSSDIELKIAAAEQAKISRLRILRCP